MGWLENRLIAEAAARTGEPCGHLEAVASSSRPAFWKFLLTLPLAGHRRHAPAELWHFARLGAITVEDCGECLATVVRLAVRDGVDREKIKTAIGQPGTPMCGLESAALRLGRLVAGEDGAVEADRDQLVAALGEAAFTELVIAAAAVRIYPALKRGLGLFKSCRLVTVDVETIH